MIHVCSLARLHDTVAEIGASHVVTLLRTVDLVERPRSVAAGNHLILGMDDIAEPLEGYTHPAEEHVADLVEFVQRWDRRAPLVMHCYAGISRSTAGAFIAACTLNPRRDETAIAKLIRDSSATAMPNPMLVGHADRLLKRNGRMVRAVQALGPGRFAQEGEPFRLDLE
ncbi:MAG: protein tyrosine phosphatase [Alphaproteobacteria bacterium]|nr:protein tyrosine phosphatase [Alphaproteobacteria bacterium]